MMSDAVLFVVIKLAFVCLFFAFPVILFMLFVFLIALAKSIPEKAGSEAILEDRSELKQEPKNPKIDFSQYKGLKAIIARLFAIAAVPLIRKVKKIARRGYYVMATVYEVEKDKNSASSYYIKARYIEPKSNRAHEFSAVGEREEDKDLVGSKVRVYVNPDNMKVYWLDSDDADGRIGFSADLFA